ncbi:MULTISPECIES: hypothetical protein [Catenuloplanes]|uniref:Uncharacterized protein n=1 Tax=Catenuloplanes niger TaxID=587534 RepID=A0AAE3ZNX8_9ACTN|nr:hypothetical protein [Catenuloplanes niger]MDR7323389.1 hypothetical protein [Catenuloplanes niger]
MIPLHGDEWGTAQEIAGRLGADVTVAMIRNWARRDGLSNVELTCDDGKRRTHYSLNQAARIEAKKDSSGRGRPRAA